ncbi:MAG: hypothetical protein LBG80_06490 [Bacteroidales bacterium]|jgi:hypothetical protein|nr:hypothetical protein [Bacteroidales bacterium]
MPDINRLNVIKIAKEKQYTISGAKIPLDFYKKELNLAFFAIEEFGYEYNRTKTGNNQSKQYKYITLTKYSEHNNHRAKERDIIIHKSTSGEYHFFTRGDDTKFARGSIFDLIQGHANKNFIETLSILDKFIAKKGLGDKNLSLNIVRSTRDSEIIEKAISEHSNVRAIDDYAYLKSRGITPEMANHPLFKDQIYNAKHTTIDGTTYDNTVFPIRGSKGIIEYDVQNSDNLTQGFDIKNNTYKGKTEGAYTGFWRSNYDRTKPIDNIFIAESPIDCISHYFLNEEKLINKNILYMATCGTLQDSQIEVIQNAFQKGIPIYDDNFHIIGTKRPENLTLLFDRDLKGGYYSAKMLNAINFPDVQKPPMPNEVDLLMTSEEKKIANIGRASFANADIICSLNDKNNSANIHFIIPNNNNDKIYSKCTEKYIQHELYKLNRDNAYKTTATEPFSLKTQQNDNTKLAFTVSFRNIQDHWKIINSFIIDNKFNKSEKIKIETAILKDFNDDLKAIKGIDRQLQNIFDNRLKTIENPYKNFAHDNYKKPKIKI